MTVVSTSATEASPKAAASTGGYGEMTVKGLSVLCDEISENGQPYVFHRVQYVQYCKSECQTNPTAPGCESCMLGGSGDF